MKKYIILGLVALFFNSCELDRFPTDSIVDEGYWNTEDDYILACNALYVNLPTYSNRDEYSDITYGIGPNSISSGSYLPSNAFGPWDGNYKKIATANKIVEFAQKKPNQLDDQIVKRYEGEARFFRAWQYYDLLRKCIKSLKE